jgi:hypothetical protein
MTDPDHVSELQRRISDAIGEQDEAGFDDAVQAMLNLVTLLTHESSHDLCRRRTIELPTILEAMRQSRMLQEN